MKWEYFGTGLTFLGIGITIVLALPPPWWPTMPKRLVRAGLYVGLAPIIFGCAFTLMGVWPEMLRPKLLPILAICTGLTILVAGMVALFEPTSSREKVAAKSGPIIPPLEIYLSDKLWIRATQIPFSNFADMPDAIKRHASEIRPRLIDMGDDTSPYTLNVIVRNNSEIDLNEASIIIDANLPFTPVTLGSKIFSPTQVRYNLPKIEAYQKIGVQHYFTLVFPVETRPSELAVNVTVQAKDAHPYMAAGAIRFKWVPRFPPAPPPLAPAPQYTQGKK